MAIPRGIVARDAHDMQAMAEGIRSLLMMFSRRIWDLLLIATLLTGGAFIWTTRIAPGAPATAQAPEPAATQPAPLVGHPAPGFTLSAIDGSQVALSAWSGGAH